MHESQLHEDNCFVTLTYDDDHLPRDWSLDKSHFQKFMKRLRRSLPQRISFFHCGEYGDDNGRPHYHACLFGVDFPDRVVCGTSGSGCDIFESAELSRLWPYGFATVGNLTFESAAYAARYCLKKVTGDAAEEHYKRVDPVTGEVYSLTPEYCTMSLKCGEQKGGIGAGWYARFGATDCVARDAIVANGVLQRVPRYYDKLRGREALRAVKRERVVRALEHADNQTPERLEVRRVVKEAQLAMLKRSV